MNLLIKQILIIKMKEKKKLKDFILKFLIIRANNKIIKAN